MVVALLKWIVFTPLAYIIRLFALLIVPYAVLFLDQDGRLPWLFRWLETHDDLGWSGPLSVEATRTKTEKYGRRIGMMFWLWRNQAYAAQYYLFSIPFLTKDVTITDVKYWGQIYRPERGLWWAFVTIRANGKKYFEFRFGWVFPAFALFVRTGWKLVPIAQGQIPPVGSTGMFTGLTPRLDG